MKLTSPQEHFLRHLAGEDVHPLLLPKNRWLQEKTVRALIDRELITADGWIVTEAGRTAIKEQSQ